MTKPSVGGSGLVSTCGLMQLGEESLRAFRSALSEMPKQRVDRSVAALNSALFTDGPGYLVATAGVNYRGKDVLTSTKERCSILPQPICLETTKALQKNQTITEREGLTMWSPKDRTKPKPLLLGMLPILLVLLSSLTANCAPAKEPTPNQLPDPLEMVLPQPRLDSGVSLEQTLSQRRSIRDYTDDPLTLAEVSQLLWAAQGITDPGGFRTAPSAGATYPLETYLVVGNVVDVAPGVYRYDPEGHKLEKVVEGDVRIDLAAAALGQSPVREGAISIVFTAVYERTTHRYGDRGIRYVHMEVGHAAQNVYLQAVALNLGTVVIGAFYDDQVSGILDLSGNEQPLYIVPVGNPE